jgi:cell division protein FtsQ
VRHVRVSGQVYSSPEVVAQVVADLEGQPMTRVQLGRVRETLAIQPWIRRVSVRRSWPTTIEIDIAERIPVAVYGGSDSNWHVYDIEGRVLATMANKPVDPVTIDGDTAPVPDGELVSEPMMQAGRLAQALPKRLRDQLVQIKVGGDGRMELQMKDQSAIYFGTIDAMREKLVGVLTVIDRCNGAPFKKLNVDAPRDIVIEPSTACTPKAPGKKASNAPKP